MGLYIKVLHYVLVASNCATLSSAYLEEDSEIDNRYRCTDEHWLKLHMLLVDQQHKGKGNSSSQTTVWHHKLLNFVQLVQSETICNSC